MARTKTSTNGCLKFGVGTKSDNIHVLPFGFLTHCRCRYSMELHVDIHTARIDVIMKIHPCQDLQPSIKISRILLNGSGHRYADCSWVRETHDSSLPRFAPFPEDLKASMHTSRLMAFQHNVTGILPLAPAPYEHGALLG